MATQPNHFPTSTREKIIQQATGLFAERGYFGVSMQTLAKESGVTKPALYYHFKSKEKLFLTVLEAVFGRLLTEISAAAKKSRNPAEALIRVLETYFSFTLERPEAGLLHPQPGLSLEHEVSKTVINVNRKLRAFFEDLFQEAAKDEQTQRTALRELWETLTIFFSRPSRLVKKNQIKKTISLLLRPFAALIK